MNSELRQKRIAVVNDITGFGRCSVAVAQPIISAMKIQCCALPTAILSAHTAFEGIFFDDYTRHMKAYMDNWHELGIEFDGICTGFLGSVKQIDLVIEFLEKFKTEKNITVVDPVMGDYGKIYSSYTDELCREMKKLVPYADVLTPNLTEACRLLDRDYPDYELSIGELEDIARNLAAQGPSKIILTGLQYGAMIRNFIYEKNIGYNVVEVKKIGEDRSGTGDVFSSIIVASLVRGEGVQQAVQKAADFISKTLEFTVKLNIPTRNGICFEEYLTDLA
jgi:pyridoxine kinase